MTRIPKKTNQDSPAPVHRPGAPLKRRIKNMGKRGLRVLFEVGQRFGFDVLPRHFYSEVPNIGDLKRDDAWKLPRSLVGVRGTDADEQFRFVEACCPREAVERMTAREYPEMGAKVRAVVVGFRDNNHQIALSARPSDLAKASTESGNRVI